VEETLKALLKSDQMTNWAVPAKADQPRSALIGSTYVSVGVWLWKANSVREEAIFLSGGNARGNRCQDAVRNLRRFGSSESCRCTWLPPRHRRCRAASHDTRRQAQCSRSVFTAPLGVADSDHRQPGSRRLSTGQAGSRLGEKTNRHRGEASGPAVHLQGKQGASNVRPAKPKKGVNPCPLAE
jgi:hypothetical protein